MNVQTKKQKKEDGCNEIKRLYVDKNEKSPLEWKNHTNNEALKNPPHTSPSKPRQQLDENVSDSSEGEMWVTNGENDVILGYEGAILLMYLLCGVQIHVRNAFLFAEQQQFATNNNNWTGQT